MISGNNTTFVNYINVNYINKGAVKKQPHLFLEKIFGNTGNGVTGSDPYVLRQSLIYIRKGDPYGRPL